MLSIPQVAASCQVHMQPATILAVQVRTVPWIRLLLCTQRWESSASCLSPSSLLHLHTALLLGGQFTCVSVQACDSKAKAMLILCSVAHLPRMLVGPAASSTAANHHTRIIFAFSRPESPCSFGRCDIVPHDTPVSAAQPPPSPPSSVKIYLYVMLETSPAWFTHY